MMASPQTEFSYSLRRVVLQFQGFLAQPANADLIKDDQSDLAGLMMEVGAVMGNVNTLLQHNTELSVRAGWFHAKYAGFLAEISRESTTNFNLLYTAKREHGWNEWDAKRFAETNGDYLKQLVHRDRLQVLVNIMKCLVDACKDRLAALQQVSNNYRAEVREATL